MPTGAEPPGAPVPIFGAGGGELPRAVTLVGGFAGRPRRRRRETAARAASIIELKEAPVVILTGEGVEGREVDVGAVGANPD